MSKVERTAPGSKLEWRITYDSGAKKWTNDRPGDGKGDREEKRRFFRDLTVKRGIQRIEKAIEAYASGKGTEKGIRGAVDALEQYSGREDAKTAARAVYKAVEGVGGKMKEGAGIAKDYVNRERKASMNEKRIAERIARTITGNSIYLLLRKGLEKYLEENGEFEMEVDEILWDRYERGEGPTGSSIQDIRGVTFFPYKFDTAKFLDSLGFDRGDIEQNLDEVLNKAFVGANIEFNVPVTVYNKGKSILEREMYVEVKRVTYRNGTLKIEYKVDEQNVMDILAENLEVRDWQDWQMDID